VRALCGMRAPRHLRPWQVWYGRCSGFCIPHSAFYILPSGTGIATLLRKFRRAIIRDVPGLHPDLTAKFAEDAEKDKLGNIVNPCTGC